MAVAHFCPPSPPRLWPTEHKAISSLRLTPLRCTCMFYCLALILLKDIKKKNKKKRVPDKKFDLVDTPETRHCNMLITLSLNLVMSTIQAQDDLRRKRKKHWGGKEIKVDVYILAEHSGNHRERPNARTWRTPAGKESALCSCLLVELFFFLIREMVSNTRLAPLSAGHTWSTPS